ncbi:MAG: hypothetical protein FWD25_04870 [Clostridia bacterium]|nr:hypothetical protein [Clostridia bacterium]
MKKIAFFFVLASIVIGLSISYALNGEVPIGGIAGVAVGFVVSIFAGPLIAQSDFNSLLKGAAPTASIDAC